MVYKCFVETSSGAITLGGAIESEIMSYQQLSKALRKPIITNFGKQKVYSSLKDIILLFYIGWSSRCALNN